MSLTQRLARAMARLDFEMHFFALTPDRQRVLLFLESRDAGAVIEGTTMADCVGRLEREADAAERAAAAARRRPSRPALRAAQRGLTVIEGGRGGARTDPTATGTS